MSLTISEEQLIASICRDSLFETVKEFWDEIIQEKPIWNWHIPFLCHELQVVAERVFEGRRKEYDLIINIPPGSTKSTIASVIFPAWVWTRMPSAKMLCGSFSDTLAMELSRKSRIIIQSEKYNRLFPDIELRADQNTKSFFVNTSGGSRYCMGTGGTVTGFHGHFLIIDDPLDPQRALSDLDMNSANVWMDETLSQRKVDKSITPLILIMQRLHQNDPTGARLEKRKAGKIRHINLPAEETEYIKPEMCRKYYRNGLLDPRRLTKRVLREARATLGEAGYAGQMLQNPIPRGGAMFKADLMRIETPPARFRQLVRYWDKAGTSKGGAYTVGVLMGVDHEGRYWILDVIRVQQDAASRERTIVQTASSDGVEVKIGVEREPADSGKESAESTLKRLAGFRAEAYLARGSKELRADTFATQVNADNVRLKPGRWNKDFIEEMRFFPRSRYKDQVDAASGAFSVLDKPRIRLGVLK